MLNLKFHTFIVPKRKSKFHTHSPLHWSTTTITRRTIDAASRRTQCFTHPQLQWIYRSIAVCFAGNQTGRLAEEALENCQRVPEVVSFGWPRLLYPREMDFFSLRTLYVCPQNNFTVVSVCIVRQCDRCSFIYIHMTHACDPYTYKLVFYERTSPRMRAMATSAFLRSLLKRMRAQWWWSSIMEHWKLFASRLCQWLWFNSKVSPFAFNNLLYILNYV